MKLVDIANMPGFNAASNKLGKEQRDVTSGKVYAHPQWKVACREHGAMNCVNEERTIWRCLTCNVGAYVIEQKASITASRRKSKASKRIPLRLQKSAIIP